MLDNVIYLYYKQTQQTSLQTIKTNNHVTYHFNRNYHPSYHLNLWGFHNCQQLQAN